MKKILIILSLLVSVNGFSQSDTAHINVTLKSKYHAWIISLMPGKGEIEKVKYMNQVANQLALPVDTAQLITVSVTVQLVKDMYLVIGSQQERLAADYNEQIKQALVPVLMSYPDLLTGIMAIGQQNANETNILVNYGFDYLKAIKQ